MAEASASSPTSSRLPRRPTTRSSTSWTTGGVSFESVALARCNPTEPGPTSLSDARRDPLPHDRAGTGGGHLLEHPLAGLDVPLPEELAPAVDQAPADPRQVAGNPLHCGEEGPCVAARKGHGF